MDVNRGSHLRKHGPGAGFGAYMQVLGERIGIGRYSRAAGDHADREQHSVNAPVHQLRLRGAPEHSPLCQVRTTQVSTLGPPPQRLTDQLVVYGHGIHFDSSAFGGEGSSVEHHAIRTVGWSADLYNRAALQLDVKFRLVRTGDKCGLKGVDA